MSLTAGTRLGPYTLVAPLGAGGMGEVYLAEDSRLNRKVALKLLPPELVSNEQAKKRLIREAKSAATLDHPNICSIYEVGEEDGRSYIAMQFVVGETLASRIGGRPLALPVALDIATQVADALAIAHARGIVHRDIKPQNVMIAASGLVKVLDFGLAKRLDGTVEAADDETASRLTEVGLVIGTLPYMSPEQVRAEPLDARSDIFSFGAMLYEMLSGQRPFAARSTAELISAILTREPATLPGQSGPLPARMDRLVRRCLAKEPAARFQTMDELQAELKATQRDVETGQAATVPSADPASLDRSRAPQAPRGVSSYRAAAAWTLGALVLAAAGYVAVLQSSKTAQAPATKASNSPGYDAYMRGKVIVNNENQRDNATAITLLEQAVSQDPDFAPAHAELARAYSRKAFYFERDADQARQLNVDSEVSIERALALDPNLAEAHAARGVLLWTHAKRFPHEQSIQSLKRAVDLNPALDDPHHQLGVIYFHIGLLDQGWSEIEQAVALRPNNTMARFRFGIISLYRGNYEEALSVLKSTPPDVNPSLVGRSMAVALFQLGRLDETSATVEEYLNTYPKDEGGNVTSVKAMLQAKAGRARDAEATIQHAIAIGRSFGHFHHTAYNIASAYALLGRPRDAVKWLEVTADDGFPCYPLFEHDANLNNIRRDAAFLAFMETRKKQFDAWQKMFQ